MRITITEPVPADQIRPGHTVMHNGVDYLVDAVELAAEEVVLIYCRPVDNIARKKRDVIRTTCEKSVDRFPSRANRERIAQNIANILGTGITCDVDGLGIVAPTTNMVELDVTMTQRTPLSIVVDSTLHADQPGDAETPPHTVRSELHDRAEAAVVSGVVDMQADGTLTSPPPVVFGDTEPF